MLKPSIRKFSLDSLLSYIQDCHGVGADELSDRNINIKSQTYIADVIECYGWSADCFKYLSQHRKD